jgi:glycerophosphoryl diester phosphodiesterase
MNYRDFISNPSRPCAVVVHRGIWEAAPENSLLAIERAIDAGHQVVEIDVRRTVDGEAVNRLRLRNRDGGRANMLTQEKVPTLDEVFELTRDRIFIHLDVKRKEIIPEVLARAQALGVDQQVDFWSDLQTRKDLAWIREAVKPHGRAVHAQDPAQRG